MTEAEKKARFIQLKAEGQSYSKISKELNISKSTCCRWNKELKEETDKRETETLDSLYKQYGATRAARVKAIGETLQRIDKAVKSKDFNDIPLDKLLTLKLKYIDTLKAEYQPITQRETISELTPQAVLNALTELLSCSRAGLITDEQADRETKILTAIIRAMQGSEQDNNNDKQIKFIIRPATPADFEQEIETDRNGMTFIEDLEPEHEGGIS